MDSTTTSTSAPATISSTPTPTSTTPGPPTPTTTSSRTDASEGAQSVSRRAITLDADQLVRRADTESVTCTAAKGVSQDFSVKDCVAASHQLAEKKTSSATVGGCTGRTLLLLFRFSLIFSHILPSFALMFRLDYSVITRQL
ncbi:hypothetical protein PSTG_18488 [Puccinia striiformis f. sp. tritici PST-78]|uniref:Uncharacterized protein n=1 Tax=Puccinia striiformis f. sp. tritici PST-78 TaxID=1165861 RepID=A0A0L0UM22_9BASI|nr:hypothetical protein PSTG_18488 [Puccinia striiformis f. sp. tritici PST-78]